VKGSKPGMFKSISLIRNVFQDQERVVGGIDILYHSEASNGVNKREANPQGNRNVSNNGTIFVAFAPGRNTICILRYQVSMLTSQNSCPLNLAATTNNDNFTLVRKSRVSFPSVIQTFSLEYSPNGFPVLLVISRSGRMYRTGNLMQGDEITSFVECKAVATARTTATTGRHERPLFLGMNMMSTISNRNTVDVDPKSILQNKEEYPKTNYSCILLCGTSSLSPPLIVMMPEDQDRLMATLEISGLEDSHHAITAVKMLHRSQLNIITWNGIRHLWRSNLENRSCAEPRWDSNEISVAMIGLADGSIYSAFLFPKETYGNEKELVSRAVKLYSPKQTNYPIVSFCLVKEKDRSGPLPHRFHLVCVDSRGCMIMIEKGNVDPMYRFQIFEPYQMLNIGNIEAAFPIVHDDMHYSIIAISSDGTTYLMGMDAINKGLNQRTMYSPLKLPLRNDISKMACSSNGESNILLMACLTRRKSFHLFYRMPNRGLSSTHSEDKTYQLQEGSPLLNSMFQLLATTGANQKELVDVNRHRRSHASIRVMFDSISPVLINSRGSSVRSWDDSKFMSETADQNLNHIAENSTETDFTAIESSICQTRTVHIFQSVPKSAPLRTPMECCKILGFRKCGVATYSKLLPVLYGGDAQCSSASARNCTGNSFREQMSTCCHNMTFTSKCFTLDEEVNGSSQKSSDMIFECPDLINGPLGVAIQIESRFALPSDVLREVPMNDSPREKDTTSVTKRYENISDMSVNEKERELIIHSGSKRSNKIEGQTYNSVSIAIPRNILKNDIFYHGRLSGFDSNFIVSLKSNDESEKTPFDVVDIVISVSGENSRSNMLRLQSYLKSIFICRSVKDGNIENIEAFLEHISHTLSGRETRRSLKILKQICSRVENERPSSGICLELYTKLRSSISLKW